MPPPSCGKGGTLTLVNSILWDNRGPVATGGRPRPPIIDHGQPDSAGLTLLSSIVQFAGGDGGGWNLDPLFLNPSSGNFRLQSASPAIDAGQGAASDSGALDLAAAARVVGGAIDLGALEYQGVAGTPLRLSSVRWSDAVCEGQAALFEVSGATNLAFSWQVSTATTFQAASSLTAASETVTPGSARLRLFPATATMSGWQVRYVESTTHYTSAPSVLSIEERSVRYVDSRATGSGDGSSWMNAFRRIPDAMAAAVAAGGCQELWVAGGPYVAEPGYAPWSYVRLHPGVAIYGGFNGTESIRAERHPADSPTVLQGTPGISLVYVDGRDVPLDEDGILDGFTLRGVGVGEGIRVLEASPVIRNCVFAENIGYPVTWANGAGRLIDCLFTNNDTGGVLISGPQAPLIVGCRFLNNRDRASAGGILVQSGSPRISDCLFQGNRGGSGGGLTVGRNAAVRAERCRFLDNTANVGAAIAIDPDGALVLQNSLIARNTTRGSGAAIMHNGTSLQLLGCTVTENEVDSSVAGIRSEGDGLVVINTILYGNVVRSPLARDSVEARQLLVAPGRSARVQFSLIQGLAAFSGSGNLDAHPLFHKPRPDEYLLSSHSPAIDAGTNRDRKSVV